MGPKGEFPRLPRLLLDENGVLLPEVVEVIKKREIPIKKLRGLKGLKRAKRLVEDVVETDADRKKKLREKRKVEGKPKQKTKRKAGTAKPKKKFVILSLKESKPGFPLLLHDEPILSDGKIIGRTTSGNYSFNYKKSMAFGYISSKEILNGKKMEIEIEKIKYEAIIENKPLHDPNNKNIKL